VIAEDAWARDVAPVIRIRRGGEWRHYRFWKRRAKRIVPVITEAEVTGPFAVRNSFARPIEMRRVVSSLTGHRFAFAHFFDIPDREVGPRVSA